MAAELVSSATSEKLSELDWTKNIEICELAARDERQAKDVIKAIKKRLGSKNPNTQLYAVQLLEMLMNNIGENIHKLVIDTGVLPTLVKIVKKKTDFPVRERIFLLLDATQTSLGGSSGRYPQYYTAYYDLVQAGVKFPQRSNSTPPVVVTAQAVPRSTLNEQLASARKERTAPPPTQQRERESQTTTSSPSSILQKASAALEVLKEVLDAVDSQNPEGAKDEFTLDLVEQCAFQKERVMHLVMTSRDERAVSQAIELNEQLQRILNRHEDLLSGGITVPGRSSTTTNGYHSTSNGHKKPSSSISIEDEDEIEEEPEQLFRRLRKGKARAMPEDDEEEEASPPPPQVLLGSAIHNERLNRPLIRPLPSEESPRSSDGHSQSSSSSSSPVVIPPPPAKHVERQKFFKEKKVDGGASGLPGHMRGLSVHSGSSSRSGSVDFSE
ncbi:ENTH/VHS/GAT family protein [Raphanus sativus]|uniref:TOM1-like protein 5 n=1 Tax=Raphanus sativus TaxID=3726 RepID=A0A6J0K1Z2_RAPSA|nr:TOM1-like protein 5 [Raphanus sativus]XP_018441677.1 TOM1-like protein 5 [Raphanus sativus]XP_018441678.1 TOM1-like protein 5 [Raphanus sativus]KAJ4887699.1 ENTH/VHS/GAT family protein [Raphanus sativus]